MTQNTTSNRLNAPTLSISLFSATELKSVWNGIQLLKGDEIDGLDPTIAMDALNASFVQDIP